MIETPYQYYNARCASLKTERDGSWLSHWRELSTHMLPRQSRFLMTDRNRGEKRNSNIINPSATLAVDILASGLMSGMSNPARQWIALRTPDPDLNEFQPVKIWLETVRNRMLEVFLRSNLYTVLPLVYRDLAVYGTSAYLILHDAEDLIRAYHFPIGSYSLATSPRGNVDCCYREFQMTARQMVEWFGYKQCSPSTQRLAEQSGSKETWVAVTHAIEPNRGYEPKRKAFSQYKAFTSCYFEAGANENKMLRESGFDSFRVIAPRWNVTGEDVYGYSPGMTALGDAKQLLLRERRKAQLIDKIVSPPMRGPSGLKDQRASLLNGDITYYDEGTAGQKFEPAYMPPPQAYQFVMQDIQEVERRIGRTFYTDLFMMFAGDNRAQPPTAREVAEKQAEKLLQLGPVLLRQNDEHYDPLIDMVFTIMAQNNTLPKAPPELRNMDLAVEYISILAQAMKMVGVGGLERATGFAGQMMAAWPDVRHMINWRETVTSYYNMMGAPPKSLNDSKEVDRLLAEEAKQKNMAMMAQQAPAAIDAAKTLSETDTTSDNALTAMMAANGVPVATKAAA